MAENPPYAKFNFNTLDALKEELARRGLELPTCDDVSILATPVQYGRLTVPNRLCSQPMEGCDGMEDGSPGELTCRKYRRLGAGGAGLLWFEACAVVPEGRANPRQLWLHEGNAQAFRRMLDQTLAAAGESMGHRPVTVLQLTHSGRYSRPTDKPRPIIAHHSGVLDPKHNLPADYPLISDEELDRLQDAYVKASQLAAEVGFDAVDIKSCHGYLLSELLAAHTRSNSRYGGSFENRTRMLLETVAKVRRALGDRIEVTSRINAYDAYEYPFGWGVDEQDKNRWNLAEPLRLIGLLRQAGYGGINITIGNPYFNPHVNRPADQMIVGWPTPPDEPIYGFWRILKVVAQAQQAYPDFPVVGSGYSWPRQFMAQFAAGAVREGWAALAGLGRGAIAYPDFAKDIIRHGRLDPRKVCVACSRCTQIMRDGGCSGCVIRDAEVYGPIYRAGRERATH